MQPYVRITARVVPRVCKPSASRTMFTTPSFFPHSFGPAFGTELAPFFRLIDSATAELVPSSSSSHRRATGRLSTFTPRFDVREVGSIYELQGELPGLEQKDLEIEFVDERTLVIRGHTATGVTETNESSNAEAAVKEADAATADSVSEKSASYQKPTVEEDEYVDAGAESSAEGAKSPATLVAGQTEQVESKSAAAAEPSFKYWVSERSVGEFERRFSFPGRVDQEAVKASLKNGILSVVVPKVVAREARRINIE